MNNKQAERFTQFDISRISGSSEIDDTLLRNSLGFPAPMKREPISFEERFRKFCTPEFMNVSVIQLNAKLKIANDCTSVCEKME